MKKDLSYISFARALAILLVVNSHATGFYPDLIGNFAGRGGAIGNTLFFFVSGFTLFLSLERKHPSFLSWMGTRLLRIWPSIWICYGAFMLTGFADIPIRDFFLPLTTNWFLGAILIFYPLFFFCLKWLKQSLLPFVALLGGIFICAFFVLEPNPQSWVVGVGSPYKLHWIYYFGIMIFGAEFARRDFFNSISYFGKSIKRTFLFGGAFCGAVVFYYAMRGGFEYAHLWKLQFLAPFALPFVCISGIAFCRAFTESFPAFFTGKCYRIVSSISNHTLEIYLTHSVGLAFCIHLVFPLNLLSLLVVTLCLAVVLKFVANFPFWLRKSRKDQKRN